MSNPRWPSIWTESQLLRALPRCPRFDRSREAELVRQFRAGDLAARDALVASQLPWIVRLVTARAAAAGGEPLDDLVQEAVIGVLESLGRFDPAKGRLTTYVAQQVGWRLSRARRRQGLVRRPATRSLRFAAEYDRAGQVASLDRHWPLPARDESAAPPSALADQVAAAVAELPERERLVVERRLAGETLRAIGAELGLSRERVRQIEARAHARLRAALAPEAGRAASN